MESCFDEERHDFESYLIKTFNYSNKVAKDCASRCKRIENHVTSDLSNSVSNIDEFENLIIKIQLYATTVCKNKKTAYTLTGSLRAAARKYAFYLYPCEAIDYPSAHGKSKYRLDS